VASEAGFVEDCGNIFRDGEIISGSSDHCRGVVNGLKCGQDQEERRNRQDEDQGFFHFYRFMVSDTKILF